MSLDDPTFGLLINSPIPSITQFIIKNYSIQSDSIRLGAEFSKTYEWLIDISNNW